MPARILVGYATRYGSTQEVAEAVAAALRDNGLEVDILPIRKIRTLDGYHGIVLGAPLFMFHWHKQALRFLSKYQKEVADRPVAIFALGPMTPGKEEEFTGAREQLDKELTKYPWFKPAALEIFGGRLDTQKLGFPFNLTLKQLPNSDLRDWDAIRAWASGLKDTLIAEG